MKRFLTFFLVSFFMFLPHTFAEQIATEIGIQPWKIQGNSNDQGGYRTLYSHINGPQNTFAYGNYPYMYFTDNIFDFTPPDNNSGNYSLILGVTVCQTGNDYSLNWDAGSSYSRINNIDTIGYVTGGGSCNVNVYKGNIVNYYFLVNAKKVSAGTDDSCSSAYCLAKNTFVLRWTNFNYKEWTVTDQKIMEYSDELVNTLAQFNGTNVTNEKLQESINKQIEIINQNQTIINNSQTQINQNQQIIDQNHGTNNRLDQSNQALSGESEDESSSSCGVICKLKNLLSYINPLSEKFFAYKLVELLINALKSLIVPDDMSFVTDFVDALESKLGFIGAIPAQIIEFAINLVSASWSEFNSISFPSISIFGYHFWNSQEIDLTEAINIFKPFKYVTDCICVVICARTLNKWREQFSGGSSE